MAPKSFNPETQTYTSPRPPIPFSTDPNLSLTAFLFHTSSSFPQSLALADAATDETLTFLQLKSLVFRISQAFLNLNVRKKDVVLIFASNSILFPICFFSIAAIAAIATSCNTMYTVSELASQVSDCNPKLIITVSELLPKIEGFNLPIRYRNINIHSFSDLIKLSDDSDPISGLPAVNVNQSDVAALLYSFGTTWKSKGVVMTHRNFITTSLMVTADQDRYS